MGVKLFAWIGGFVFSSALSFSLSIRSRTTSSRRGMRIVIGALIGLALIGPDGRRREKTIASRAKASAPPVFSFSTPTFSRRQRFTNSFR